MIASTNLLNHYPFTLGLGKLIGQRVRPPKTARRPGRPVRLEGVAEDVGPGKAQLAAPPTWKAKVELKEVQQKEHHQDNGQYDEEAEEEATR